MGLHGVSVYGEMTSDIHPAQAVFGTAAQLSERVSRELMWGVTIRYMDDPRNSVFCQMKVNKLWFKLPWEEIRGAHRPFERLMARIRSYIEMEWFENPAWVAKRAGEKRGWERRSFAERLPGFGEIPSGRIYV